MLNSNLNISFYLFSAFYHVTESCNGSHRGLGNNSLYSGYLKIENKEIDSLNKIRENTPDTLLGIAHCPSNDYSTTAHDLNIKNIVYTFDALCNYKIESGEVKICK